MSNTSDIEKAISLLQTAAKEGGLDFDQLSKIESTITLATETRQALDLVAKAKEVRELSPDRQYIFFKRMELYFKEKGLPKNVIFADVKRTLEANPSLIWSLEWMMNSGRSNFPGVIAVEGDALVFADTSSMPPENHMGLDYNQAAAMAKEFGVEMMDEAYYTKIPIFFDHQTGRPLDDRTHTQLKTPNHIAEAGYAIFAQCNPSESDPERRYKKSVLPITTKWTTNGWRAVLKVPKVIVSNKSEGEKGISTPEDVNLKEVEDIRQQNLRYMAESVRNGYNNSDTIATEVRDLLSPEEQADELMRRLERSFIGINVDGNVLKIIFADLKKALEASPSLMASLVRMEQTGGSPNVIDFEGGAFVFADCSEESPYGRRGLDYNQAAAMAKEFGVEMMSEEVFNELRGIKHIDKKTSSWLKTPGNFSFPSIQGFNAGVGHCSVGNSDKNLGWRGVLRVPKARELSPEEQVDHLMKALESRFEKAPTHYKRPEGVNFADVKKALEANPTLMASLALMEQTGGAPDVIGVEADAFIFADCSEESPLGRRELNYHQSDEMAKQFGVDMMSKTTYKVLEKVGYFDKKSNNWFRLDDIINHSGFPYGGMSEGRTVGPGHSYANRGWRGMLRVPKA